MEERIAFYAVVADCVISVLHMFPQNSRVKRIEAHSAGVFPVAVYSDACVISVAGDSPVS